MTLTITDTLITSDEVDQTAYLHDGQWAVDGFPFRTFGQNGAITAMSLAELDASGLAQTEPKYAALAAAWREELGLPGLAPETTSRTSTEPAEGAEPDQPRTSFAIETSPPPTAPVTVINRWDSLPISGGTASVLIGSTNGLDDETKRAIVNALGGPASDHTGSWSTCDHPQCRHSRERVEAFERCPAAAAPGPAPDQPRTSPEAG